jgi:hypothetical protein
MFRAFIIAGVLLLAALPASAAETRYSSVIDDLPLMQGMEEKPDSAVTFDAPEGRIVEIRLLSQSAPAAVRRFYAEALPPLGWKPQGNSAFVRDNEKLQISFEDNAGTTIVRFILTPKGKK